MPIRRAIRQESKYGSLAIARNSWRPAEETSVSSECWSADCRRGAERYVRAGFRSSSSTSVRSTSRGYPLLRRWRRSAYSRAWSPEDPRARL